MERFLQALPIPRSWLESTAKRYPNITLMQSKDRAYADQNVGVLSINILNTDVVLHEFLHLVQVAVPEVETLAREMHRRRTAGQAPSKLRSLTNNAAYRPDEEAREDQYFHPYVGKEYNTVLNGQPAPAEPLEILTMVLQALIGAPGSRMNRSGASALRNSLISKDKESAAFGLGLLLRYA